MGQVGVLRVCGGGALLCLLAVLALALAGSGTAAEAPKPQVLWEEYPLHPPSSVEPGPAGAPPATPERAVPAAAGSEPRSSTVGLVVFLLAVGTVAALALAFLMRLLLKAMFAVRIPRPRVPDLRRRRTAGGRA